jgi:type IV pilus assembly protein PilE
MSTRRQLANASPRHAGFTLLEAMITVAVLAIIATIALPSYTEFLQRGKLVEAKVGLSDMRVRLEQHFLDTRTYPTACIAPAPGPAPLGQIYLPAASRYFTVDCAFTATTYTITATGNAANGMAGFAFAIDETDTRRTVALPAGWQGAGNPCWVSRKSGEC